MVLVTAESVWVLSSVEPDGRVEGKTGLLNLPALTIPS